MSCTVRAVARMSSSCRSAASAVRSRASRSVNSAVTSRPPTSSNTTSLPCSRTNARTSSNRSTGTRSVTVLIDLGSSSRTSADAINASGIPSTSACKRSTASFTSPTTIPIVASRITRRAGATDRASVDTCFIAAASTETSRTTICGAGAARTSASRTTPRSAAIPIAPAVSRDMRTPSTVLSTIAAGGSGVIVAAGAAIDCFSDSPPNGNSPHAARPRAPASRTASTTRCRHSITCSFRWKVERKRSGKSALAPH